MTRPAARTRAPHVKPGDDRGSGTVLAVTTVLLMSVVAGFAVVAGVLVESVHEVRGLADAAALGAARAHQRGANGCGAAQTLVRAGKGELVACRVTGTQQQFAVAVTVRRRWQQQWAGVPQWVAAQAWAGPVS